MRAWRGFAFVGLLFLASCGGEDGGSTAAIVPPAAPSTCTDASSTPPQALAVVAPTAGSSFTSATSPRFAASGACASCHRTDTAAAPPVNVDAGTGQPMGLINDWGGSLMAQAARDPYFVAVVAAESALTPSLATALQGKCLRCHAPMAAVEAEAAGQSLDLAGLATSALGQDGVSCALCHRIEPTGLGSETTASGRFVIGDETGTARRIYGPYPSVATAPMMMQIGMTPVEGAHIRTSALCAPCHVLRTEAIDPSTGRLTGTSFPEQMSYKEWLASGMAASASCQSCHVPSSAAGARLSSVGPTRIQAPFGKHHFVGGNTFVLSILRADRAGANLLAVPADLSQIDAALARTDNLLTQASARLRVEPCVAQDVLTVALTVTNLTGHKLPTGYPSRRAWLHLKVTDANGRLVFESGATDSRGEIVGTSAAPAPHYDQIERADQVQIYEAVMVDIAERPTLRLTYAARYLKDNRLLPAGMSAATNDPDIRPVGTGADPNFSGGSDRVSYRMSAAGYAAPFRVEAEFLYQSIPPRWVAQLEQTPLPATSRFVSMAASADPQPRRLAAVSATAR